MLEFTKTLYELFVLQKISLSQSLLIMSSKPKPDAVSKTAASIYAALEKGSYFSNALKSCGPVSFDAVYISFISISEKNGDLQSALSYLKEKLERQQNCRKKIAEASIYPAFVILLAVMSSVFIGAYTKTADYLLLIKYVSVLLIVSLLMYFLILKLLGENSLFEAFSAVDFLVKSGIELTEAVACAIQIAGPSTKTGKLFENARLNLSYGMDLQSAFNCCDKKSKLYEAFYYADIGGSRNDLFGKIASNLEAQKERVRTLCFSLIEPLFIVITGVFILAILMTFFMPLINEVGFI
jgi:type II secretory pathway component PulF